MLYEFLRKIVVDCDSFFTEQIYYLNKLVENSNNIYK